MQRAMKLESLDRQRRLTAIWILITNPGTSLMNYRQLHKLFERFQYFTKEFHFPETMQWSQMGVYQTISIKPINATTKAVVRGTYQFETDLVKAPDGSVKSVLMVPRVRADTPLGMGLMQTDEDYDIGMYNFEDLEKQRQNKIKYYLNEEWKKKPYV